MASTLTPHTSPNDHRRPYRNTSEASVINPNHMSNAPADANNHSPFSGYHSNSNFGTPSTFDTSSDNGGYSEFSYQGQDEFFGVSFDAPEDFEPNIDLLGATSTEPTAFEPAISSSQLTSAEGPNGPTSAPMSVAIHPSPARLHNPSLPNIHPSVAMVSHYDQQTRSLSIPGTSTMGGGMKKRPITGSRNSDSSRGSVDCISPNAFSQMPHSPRVQIQLWGSDVVRDLPPDSDVEDEAYGGNRATTYDAQHGVTQFDNKLEDIDASEITISQVPSYENDAGFEFDGELKGRQGVLPERRKSMSEVPIQNFKDIARSQELEAKKSEVEEWASQVGGDTDDEEITPTEYRHNLSAPTMPRRRAKSTGAEYNRGGFDPDFRFPEPVVEPREPPEDENPVEPVSDAASIRENRYQEGQSYFNVHAREITPRDRILMSQSRAFHDGIAYHKTVDTKTQPDTANAAIARYNEQSDTYSVLSRSATWGTRRRSEPSIADIESIRNGQTGLIKRFSFGRDKKEKKPSIFQEGFQQLSSIVRKKSDAKSKPTKRGRESSIQTVRKESQGSLAPPRAISRTRPESPRLDTNVGPGNLRRTHSGSGSLSATSPNRNVFGGISNVIRRARSRSDLSRRPEQDGLVGMIRAAGGPFVPIPQPTEDIKPIEHSDLEGDDDDDDDLADDGERQDLDQSPIIPTFKGFHDHVIRLNPEIEDKDQYLIDRIAHQQVVRYKCLLGWRVKHSAAVRNTNCNSGRNCIELGGSPALLQPKGQGRHNSTTNNSSALEGSDEDSNSEGKLVKESFPVGVPMPPATSLPAEFECQLCFKVKKFNKPSDWTKHVHEDVQPFTCTYSNCREPKSFKRKADWVRHENERHRHLEWWTCQVDDCQHRCYRKDNFLQHLVREHKRPEPKNKTKAAMKNAGGLEEETSVLVRECHHETTAKAQDEPCKFCGKVFTSWKKLTVHLAKHMEHISLPVLRLVEQQHVNPDMIISPVEPPPVRQTPLTPVDMNRDIGLSAHSGLSGHSGNSGQGYMGSSSSISPQFPQPSSFSSPGGMHVNGQGINNFGDFIPAQTSMYGNNLGNIVPSQGLDYQIHAPAPQHTQLQNNNMFSDSTMQFDDFGGIDSSVGNTLPQRQTQQIYTPMNQSPLIAQQQQSRSFNQFSNPSVSPQTSNGFNLSPHHLSPEPNFMNSNQQQAQLAAFQNQNLARQSLTPDPSNFIPVSAAHMSNMNSYSSNNNMTSSGGMMDSTTSNPFNFQGLHQGLDAGLDMAFNNSNNGSMGMAMQQQRSRGGSASGSLGGPYSTSPMSNTNSNAPFGSMGRGNGNGHMSGFDNQQQPW